MNVNLEEMQRLALPIIEHHQKELVSLSVNKEFGFNKITFVIDDPDNFMLDIDEVATINEEILDVINDLIPDDYYLEITSLGIERELVTPRDFEKALNQYIYISTYQKQVDASNLKELYGYLEAYDEDTVTIRAMIKTREKVVIVKRSDIAKIRLAVNFKEN